MENDSTCSCQKLDLLWVTRWKLHGWNRRYEDNLRKVHTYKTHWKQEIKLNTLPNTNRMEVCCQKKKMNHIFSFMCNILWLSPVYQNMVNFCTDFSFIKLHCPIVQKKRWINKYKGNGGGVGNNQPKWEKELTWHKLCYILWMNEFGTCDINLT